MYGIYIHIPFCLKKCKYCDFNSYRMNINEKKRYLKALEKEIEMYSEEFKGKKADTVFLGGGTPSILKAEEIERLFEVIRKNLNISENAEITMECNPGTLDREKLEAMKRAGVNRLSIGLQAVQNNILDYIGRVHTFEKFKENYKLARECGFDNINIDLMYNLPHQSTDNWKESLKEVVALNPEHISAYSLILEEGTQMCEMYENGEFELADEDTDIDMYRYTIEYLAQNGYKQYEISNYAKEGKECLHNIIYWKCLNYIGLGAGASGYIGDTRYTNKAGIPEYCNAVENGKIPFEQNEIITSEEAGEEIIFMGLRMNEGIEFDDFMKRSGKDLRVEKKDVINNLLDNGLIDTDNKHIKLTQKGREISNNVFLDLLS